MMQKDKKYVAFVCTGNTCRSPMAEAIFNKIAYEKEIDVTAESFGIATSTGASVSTNSVLAMKELGIDLADKTATAVNDVDNKKYDKFYCMSQSHSRMLQDFFGVSPDKIKVLNVCDPYGGALEVYTKCRDEIYNAIKELFTDDFE